MINEFRKVRKAFKSLEKAYLSEDKNSDEYLAAVCIFEHITYKLLSTSDTDKFIGFRTFFNLIKQVLTYRNDIILELDKSGKMIILAGGVKSPQVIIDYIEQSSGKKAHSYMEKGFLLQSPIVRRKDILVFLPFAFLQAIRSTFHVRRSNMALVIVELAEIAALLKFIRVNQIDQVFDFLPYEKDSNFMALVLASENVKVTKNPSPGPLALLNRIVIADTMTLSTPYQQEEVKRFASTMRVKEFLLWPPERALTYYKNYITHKPTPEFTLGYYSHGQWLRKEQLHTDNGLRAEDAEDELLELMGKFVRNNPKYKLVVFPHPREKSANNIDKAKAYYDKMLQGVAYELVKENIQTTSCFDKVDIAIVLYSTVIYERLFCGYKTIISNKSVRSFPMNNSALNRICFQNYEGMERLINRYINKDTSYFFEDTGLENYQYKYYPTLEKAL